MFEIKRSNIGLVLKDRLRNSLISPLQDWEFEHIEKLLYMLEQYSLYDGHSYYIFKEDLQSIYEDTSLDIDDITKFYKVICMENNLVLYEYGGYNKKEKSYFFFSDLYRKNIFVEVEND